MREIKFRGLTENDKWIVGYFTAYDDRTYIKSIDRDQRFGCGIDVKPESVGQFTGSFDKSGKEIYEGDIVRVPADHYRMFLAAGPDGDAELSQSQPHFLINWLTDAASFMAIRIRDISLFGMDSRGLYLRIIGNEAEIIGNMHENPDLLENRVTP